MSLSPFLRFCSKFVCLLALSFQLFSTSSAQTSTLVGHWKLDEPSGATLLDNSGLGNNASIQNTSSVVRSAGVYGLALTLPGTTNRFATAPNNASLNITDKITIAAWISPSEALSSNTILSKTGNDGYELGINKNGKVEFRFNSTTNGNTYQVFSNANYPANGTTWMHVAATFDGTTTKIYINGILDKTVTYGSPVAIKTNTSGLYIGALAGSQRWKGSLDDIRLYHGALTPAEIAAAMQNGITAVPDAPVLAAPANTAINIPYNQTLSWNTVPGAAKYRAEVSTTSNFTTTFFAQDDITTTSAQLAGLSPNTTYYWRVRASNSVGDGNWSPTWSFTTEPLPPPSAPTLISPANASVNIPYNQTLSWNTVSGAIKYRAEVSENSTFTTTFLAQDDIISTSVQLANLLPNTTYYWRVRATNDVGNGNWSTVWSFTTTPPLPPPASPTLLAPANAAINIPYNPTLTWNGVPGATKYRAEVSEGSSFITTFIAQDDILNTSFQLANLVANTTYYWRVRASNSAGDGNWSAVWSFKTAVTPTAGNELVGHWKLDEASGATLLDNSGLGNNAVLQNTSSITRPAGVYGLCLSLPGTTNRFAIAPNNASLNITDKITIAAWIRPIEQLSTNTILAKTGNDGYELGINKNGKVEFRFNATTNGNTYQVFSNTGFPFDGITWMHVAATFDGTTTKIYINGILDKTVTYGSPVAIKTNTSGLYIGALAGSQRWKGSLDDIRLYHGALTPAEIAAAMQNGITAVPDAPALMMPANAAINIPYSQTFSWNAVPGAAKYRAEVSTTSNFTTTFFAQDDITTTSVQAANLAPNTVYYWRVRASNSIGDGNWSATWSFTTAPLPVPAAPTLVAPSNASINIPYNQTLTWNTVSGATKYRAEVSESSTFTTTFLAQDDIISTSVQLANLLPGTIYYWRVRASNSGGDGTWSAVWSFTTLPAPPAAPILVAPTNSATNIPANQTLSWSAVAGAGYYKAEVSQDANFTTTFLSQDNIAGTSVQLSGLSLNTLYYWRIRASNNGGDGAWSSVWSFTTALPAPPAAPILLTPSNNAANIGASTTLSWNAATGAFTYRAEVSEDINFATTFLTQDDIATTSLPVSNLLPGKTYFWRIRGVNAGGNGAWSATWSFSTAAAPALTLIHYWNFNGATVAEMIAPTLTLNGGSLTESFVSGSFSEIGTGNGFTGVNARNGDVVGNHYRLNNPVGSIMTFNISTINYKDVVIKYETRRSTSGAEIQKVSYSTDGSTYIPYQTLSISNVAPELKTFDFTAITAVNNNANFKLRIEFEQGAGTLAGNNRFDNVTVEGTSLGLIQPPGQVLLLAPADNNTGISSAALLSWNAATGASTYRAEVSEDINFATTFLTQDDIATTSLPVSNLLPGKTYFWRIRGVNAGGNGAWSATWSFSTAAAPALTLIHYWNFNGATVPEMIAPTLTLNGGSLTESFVSGSFSEIGTGNGFTGVNARNGDVVGNHYRLNNPVGSIMTFNISTINYKDVVIKYETRRSTSGAEIQKVSYSTDGSTYIPYQTLSISNVAPELKTFDFTAITAVNNNANFKLRIEFEQGAGTLAGNNRFDNVTVEGTSLGGTIPVPDKVQTTTPADNAQGVILHPVLNWLTEANAVSYEVQVATDNLFGNIVTQKSVSGSLSYKLESALVIATNYYWRVRAVNTGGNGPWSDLKTFQTILQPIVYKLAINEAMSSNSNVIADEDGSFEDWIEILNYGSSPIDLNGFGLTDAASTPFKWIFPAKILAPGEFLVVWASSKNRVNPNLPLHTNFAISAQGEELMLTSPDGEWNDYMPAVAIPSNSSRGRQPDGTGNFVFFSTSTPGVTNTGGVGELLTKVSFSQAPGIYPGNLTLALTHPDPLVTIRYTLDGSEPTEASPAYQQPLQIVDKSGDPNVVSLIPTNYIVGTSRSWVPPNGVIRKGTVVRAKAFKTNAKESPSITGTFLVLPGRQYTIPVVSVVAPLDSLFSFNRGIYVPGVDYVSGNDETGNYFQKGDSSERAGSVEFYSPALSFQQNIGLRINGNSTRKYPQKSLRLIAKSQYGNSSLDYPVFPNYPLSSFKRLVLSSSGNDWGHTMFNDAVASILVSHIMPTESYRPSVTFVNGEYWGIHNIRERADKYFLGQKYGVDPDNIDHLVEKYEVEEGDTLDYKEMLNYIQNTDLTSDANFEGVQRRMDVDNFIDYMSAEVYYANRDWPHNNIEYWRARVPNGRNPGAPLGQDGRWRWIFHDIDAGFGDASFDAVNWVTSLYSPFNGKDWPNLLLRKLLTNQQFKTDFVNRIADQMNTAFVVSRMNQVVDSLRALIAPEIPEHIQRWSRPSSVNGWTKDVDSLKIFAAQRPAFLRQHLKNAFGIGNELTVNLDVTDKAHGSIKINSITINSATVGLNPQQPYPWQGVYFGNVPIKLKALANPGYMFDHWLVDGQLFDSEQLNVTPVANTSIKAFFVQTNGIKPQLISPSNGATTLEFQPLNPTWQAVPLASTYRLQISTAADFSTIVFDQNGIANTFVNVPGLTYNSVYYWRIAATGTNGISDWSDAWSFTTKPFPGVVTLIAPANSATNIAVNPVLSWAANASASHYSVQLSAVPDFSTLLINVDNTQALSYPAKGLLRGQAYYWRVKANNASGSSPWYLGSFTTQTLVYDANFVGHWKLDEVSGVTLIDNSLYGNHATLQNVSDVYRVNAIEGLGLSLPGSTSRYAIAPNSPSLNITSQITIAAWMNPNLVNSQSILSKAGSDGYELAINANGKVEFRINPDTYGSTYRVYSKSSYAADGNTWTHVAATFNGATSKIYINGVLDTTVTFKNPTSIIPNNSNLQIGAVLAGHRWKGTLDDIQLYSRVLTAAEISELVNPVPNHGGIPLYSVRIPLEQTSGLTIYPNPFRDRIVLDFKGEMKGAVSISLIDAVGRTYFKSRQPLENNRFQVNLANTNLKTGLYFLVIKSPEYNGMFKVFKH